MNWIPADQKNWKQKKGKIKLYYFWPPPAVSNPLSVLDTKTKSFKHLFGRYNISLPLRRRRYGVDSAIARLSNRSGSVGGI
jgi:hypothetical protein